MPVLAEIAIVLILVLLNGVFSGAEIAILSLRRTRLQELTEAGSGAARAVARLREHPEWFLATVQVGITVVGATAAAFSGASVAARVEPLLAAVPGVGARADQLSFALVVALVSYLSLVLGELVPKSLALHAAEPYALLIGRPLEALAFVARPLIWFLTASSNLVLKVFGDRTSFTEARLSSDELRQLVDEAASSGAVDAHAGQIAARALAFSDLDVTAVMVPRREIVSVPRSATLEQLADVARTHGHARVLFYEGDPENVLGLINLREVLARSLREPGFTPDQAVHPVTFVPETTAATAVLRTLQAHQRHIAVVVDEQGGVRGMVTLEDLVEELVGEILSEGDRPAPKVTREADGAIVLAGSLPVHEANRELDLQLPESASVDTIGGLCTERAGRIPARGDRLRIDAWEVEILDASHRRVKTVRLRPAPPA